MLMQATPQPSPHLPKTSGLIWSSLDQKHPWWPELLMRFALWALRVLVPAQQLPNLKVARLLPKMSWLQPEFPRPARMYVLRATKLKPHWMTSARRTLLKMMVWPLAKASSLPAIVMKL
jgi:hypothetical protein